MEKILENGLKIQNNKFNCWEENIMNRTLIFDLDGTLWDTTEQVTIVWNNVAKKYNIDIENFSIKSIMGLTTSEIISELFDNNSEIGRSFINECQKSENEYLSMYGGNIYINTISTIKKLAQKFDLYIVSNCQDGYIQSFLNFYDLKNFFKDYECSGKTNLTKVDNLKLLMKRNNIDHSIYIGDTEKDYCSAINSNNKFIWATYGFGVCKNYDYSINDISELLTILQNKNLT